MLRLIVPILLWALMCGPVFALDEQAQTPAAGVRPQVYPAAQLATLFPAAVQISFGVAVVPDPLVPRYRRPYDLEVIALELGMLQDGYVLDRFYLPWTDDRRD